MDILVQILFIGRLQLLLKWLDKEAVPFHCGVGMGGDAQMPLCRGLSFRLLSPKKFLRLYQRRQSCIWVNCRRMALYFTPANDHSESYAFPVLSSESTLLIPHLGQGSPTFLAPGTSFLEDNFSRDGGKRDEGRVVQVVMPAMGNKWREATDEALPLPVNGLGVGDPWPKWLKPGCHHSLHIRVKKTHKSVWPLWLCTPSFSC